MIAAQPTPEEFAQPDEKLEVREAAAFQGRHWVRLTATCNNNCGFCLDMDLQDGRILSPRQIKRDIDRGPQLGRGRVILSGGEATIHPAYIDFVRYAKHEAGYEWVQTVSNGRAFMKPEFCDKAIEAGLDEVTISIHGDTAELHDELVGAKGAFVQTMKGLINMLHRPVVVSVDICLNRQNYQRLPSMMKLFLSLGVREFDILQVIPFGSAWPANKSELFYDIDEAYPYLRKVFELARRPDVHIWTNRFPVYFLEDFEELIQDPHKLTDETNGRKEEYETWLTGGQPLSCYGERCEYCFLENVCDTLIDYRRASLDKRCDDLRVHAKADMTAEALGTWVKEYGADRVELFGQNAASVDALLRGAPYRKADDAEICELSLELDGYAGVAELIAELGGAEKLGVVELRPQEPEDCEAALGVDGVRICHAVNLRTADWIAARDPSERESLWVRTYERGTDSVKNDVDLSAFFKRPGLSPKWEARGLPMCVTKRNHDGLAGRPRLDIGMIRDDGFIDIFGYTHHYIEQHYFAKSMRCRVCSLNDRCRGMQINYLRNKGFSQLDPVVSEVKHVEAQPDDQRAPDRRGPDDQRVKEAWYPAESPVDRGKAMVSVPGDIV